MNGKDKAIVRLNYDQIKGYSRVFYESGLFSDIKGEAQAMVKVVAGQEMGIGPIAAMTSIHIIKGRITLSANLIASRIRQSDNYDFKVIEMDNDKCEIAFTREGEELGRSLFTTEDAEKAGLVHGDNWKHYPKNMLYARAISNGAKWYCPDIFSGPVYTPDELGADVDGETGEIINMQLIDEPPPSGPEEPTNEWEPHGKWNIKNCAGALPFLVKNEIVPAINPNLMGVVDMLNYSPFEPGKTLEAGWFRICKARFVDLGNLEKAAETANSEWEK